MWIANLFNDAHVFYNAHDKSINKEISKLKTFDVFKVMCFIRYLDARIYSLSFSLSFRSLIIYTLTSNNMQI